MKVKDLKGTLGKKKLRKKSQEDLEEINYYIIGGKMEIKIENLKEYLTNLDYETIKNLIKKSKNDNEKKFYVDLLNLILQYQQEETIKKGIF